MTQRFSSREREAPPAASPGPGDTPSPCSVGPDALGAPLPKQPPQGSAIRSPSFPATPGSNAARHHSGVKSASPPPSPHRFRDTGTHAHQPRGHGAQGPSHWGIREDLLPQTHTFPQLVQQLPGKASSARPRSSRLPPQASAPRPHRAPLRRPLAAARQLSPPAPGHAEVAQRDPGSYRPVREVLTLGLPPASGWAGLGLAETI